MWIDTHRRQHRVCWRTPKGTPGPKRSYLAFETRADAESFQVVAEEIGLDAARAALSAQPAAESHRTSDVTDGPAMTPTPVAEQGPLASQGLSRLATGMSAPTPARVTLDWVAQQFVPNRTAANPQTRDGYLRDLRRFVLPYFVDRRDGSLEIGLVSTYDLPTAEGDRVRERAPVYRTSRASRLAAATLAAATLTIGAFVAPAQAAAPRVDTSAPQYDSAGGTVPVIVTAYNVPADRSATITAKPIGAGATVLCPGGVWHNRARATASRKCYLTLGTTGGHYNVQGYASLGKAGVAALNVSGTGTRAVLATHTGTGPISAATIASVERCWRTSDTVSLTFDDGGSSDRVKSILATLKRNNVKGTFFFRGDWARYNPTLFAQIKAEGHHIGNHTSSHVPLSKVDDATVSREIAGGTASTTTPKLLRPPFAAGALTTRLGNLAASKGYKVCRWTTDTYDWEHPSTATMVERIIVGDYRTPPVAAGGNILMHPAGANTPASIQAIIDAIRRKGLKLEALR